MLTLSTACSLGTVVGNDSSVGRASRWMARRACAFAAVAEDGGADELVDACRHAHRARTEALRQLMRRNFIRLPPAKRRCEARGSRARAVPRPRQPPETA